MLTKRVIPCLDVKNGRVVKGIKFVELRDAGNPVDCAAAYDAAGADELVYLDITASAEGRSTLLEVVRATAEQIFIPLTVGGGVSSLDHFSDLLRAGADKVAVNTAAVENPRLLTEAAGHYGSQCVVAAVDAKRNGVGWRVYTHGGRKATALDAVHWCREVVKYGAGEILLTSIDRDGTKLGFDYDLLKRVSNAVPVPVIASGGAGQSKHFVEAITAGASAVLAASLFHFNELSIAQVKADIRNAGYPVRIV